MIGNNSKARQRWRTLDHLPPYFLVCEQLRGYLNDLMIKN